MGTTVKSAVVTHASARSDAPKNCRAAIAVAWNAMKTASAWCPRWLHVPWIRVNLRTCKAGRGAWLWRGDLFFSYHAAFRYAWTSMGYCSVAVCGEAIEWFNHFTIKKRESGFNPFCRNFAQVLTCLNQILFQQSLTHVIIESPAHWRCLKHVGLKMGLHRPSPQILFTESIDSDDVEKIGISNWAELGGFP